MATFTCLSTFGLLCTFQRANQSCRPLFYFFYHFYQASTLPFLPLRRRQDKSRTKLHPALSCLSSPFQRIVVEKSPNAAEPRSRKVNLPAQFRIGHCLAESSHRHLPVAIIIAGPSSFRSSIPSPPTSLRLPVPYPRPPSKLDFSSTKSPRSRPPRYTLSTITTTTTTITIIVSQKTYYRSSSPARTLS